MRKLVMTVATAALLVGAMTTPALAGGGRVQAPRATLTAVRTATGTRARRAPEGAFTTS